jgi:hypothetical protein
MAVLIIDDISHVNDLMLIMTLQASQINIIVEELIHLRIDAVLNGLDLLLLLVQQLAKIGLTFLFIIIHYFS